ncbi:SRPBCC family protein [Spirillospora sp. NBC_01491]|uniref:SRPBCC family protein n=1 Tax=Spirillospora sp. NBC_01491 TaxID=2976007 RepID=UPI002E327ABE|nr:SRPBCC domain-containing protein [Spirillospora sp. NBC_01491]
MTHSTVYEIVRDFAVPRGRVYAAWTRPERLARWFGPRVFTTPVHRVVLDVRPGGRWRAVLVGDEGLEVTLGGAYREVEEPGRLVFTTGDPDDPVDGPAAVVTLTLDEHDGTTTMRFHHHGVDTDPEHAEGAKAGWIEFFDRLAEHLAAQTTSPRGTAPSEGTAPSRGTASKVSSRPRA